MSNLDWSDNLVGGLLKYFEPEHREGALAQPRLRLEQYPRELLRDILANDAAHPLLEMAHIDQHGYPLITVMGFALMDGSVVVGSRHNGVKIRRLQDDPRCSVNYHNKRTKDELACVTLVGRARIDRDVDRVREYNRLLSAKVYPDAAPDAARRDEMISAMDAAERVLVVLDAVDAVYIQAPPARVHTSGSPSRLISWRAAADPSQ